MNSISKPQNSWDKRNCDGDGSSSQDLIFIGVGKALSKWNGLEFWLSNLFAHLLDTSNISVTKYAYGVVRTFEGRLELIKKASEGFSSRVDHWSKKKFYKRA